jgi:hypothetical protein
MAITIPHPSHFKSSASSPSSTPIKSRFAATSSQSAQPCFVKSIGSTRNIRSAGDGRNQEEKFNSTEYDDVWGGVGVSGKGGGEIQCLGIGWDVVAMSGILFWDAVPK